MLRQRTAPIGIDFYISELQNKLHTNLLSTWDIDTSLYECYDRCYRNKKDDGYIAEFFTGGKDYKEVYWDDRLAAVSFFGMSNNITIDLKNVADVHLVYFVNLSLLKPSIVHRADEEVRNDVQQITGRFSSSFQFVSTDLWLENVLSEYAGSRREDRLKAVDMHPVHCFRMNFILRYDPNKNC
jgi:hypothetical protein